MRRGFRLSIWVAVLMLGLQGVGCSSDSGQSAPDQGANDDRGADYVDYGDEWPTSGVTSTLLIAEAFAAGELDGETEFVYRVLAAFRDPRLPLEYRGYDASVPDSLVGAELAARYTELSAENQAFLGPYLIPPIYEGSWFDLRETGAEWPRASYRKIREPGQPPPCQGILSQLPWVSIDREHVRVWYPNFAFYPDYIDSYEAFADALEDDAWPALTGLLGRNPFNDQALLPDDYKCSGEDGRVDAYFAPLGYGGIVSTFADIPCAPAPAWIQLNPLASIDSLRMLAAHEFMHVLQFTYRIPGMCLTVGLDQLWWGEATAVWAETYVYPNPSSHVLPHEYAGLHLTATESSLHDMSDLAIGGYTAWLFPLYLERQLSIDLIGASFSNMERYATAVEAVHQTIPGGWAQHFPVYSTYSLNEPPVDQYTDWDEIYWSVTPQLETGLTVGDYTWVVPWAVHSLAYHVYRFDVPTSNRLVDFDNTWNREGLDDITIRAFLGDGGRLRGPENWDGRRRVMLCRDDPSFEDLNELVLIASNTSHGAPAEAIGPVQTPYVAAWDVPCWRLVGSSRYDWEAVQTVSSAGGSATMTIRREGVANDLTFEVLDVDPTFPLPRGSFEFRSTSGEFTWSGEVIYEIEEVGEPPVRVECELGPVTAAITQADGFVAIVPKGAPGVLGPGYSGMGTTEVGLSTSHCDSRIPPVTMSPEYATWFATDATYFSVPSSGTLADDVSVTETLESFDVEWSSEWSFRVP